MHFVHFLSIESAENTHRLRKSVAGRSTGLECGGLVIEFSSGDRSARNQIETHSYFNQLMCHTFEGLFPEIFVGHGR